MDVTESTTYTNNNAVEQLAKADASESEQLDEQVALFGDILYNLQHNYVDPINPKRLFETAVGAMLQSLDPYTEYENVGAARNLQESVSGKYGGIGLVITDSKEKSPSLMRKEKIFLDKDTRLDETSKARGVSVVDAFEGYAFDFGLRVGDRIVSVDGVDTRAMNVEQVRNLLRGDPDTNVVRPSPFHLSIDVSKSLVDQVRARGVLEEVAFLLR